MQRYFIQSLNFLQQVQGVKAEVKEEYFSQVKAEKSNDDGKDDLGDDMGNDSNANESNTSSNNDTDANTTGLTEDGDIDGKTSDEDEDGDGNEEEDEDEDEEEEDSDFDGESKQSRKSLPHKKRIPKKLKRGNTAPKSPNSKDKSGKKDKVCPHSFLRVSCSMNFQAGWIFKKKTYFYTSVIKAFENNQVFSISTISDYKPFFLLS